MRVLARRRARYHERNLVCGAAILASIGLAEFSIPPAHAAEQCLARPGRQAPAGSRWYYLTDRATKRRCWFLGKTGEKGRQEAAKRASARKARAAPEEIPLPPPRAMARDVPSDALDQPQPVPQEEAQPVTQGETAIRSSGEEPASIPGGGLDYRWTTTVLHKPWQAWPVPAASEPAAAYQPPPGNSRPLPASARATDGLSKMSFASERPFTRPAVDSEKPTASADMPGVIDLFAVLALALSVGGALFAFPALRRAACALGASRKDPDQTTEYLPVLSHLVAALDPNDAEAHRAAYDRARRTLVDGLREIEPALPKATIAAEQAAFEAAVRRIEAKRTRPTATFLRLVRRAWFWTGLDNAGARLRESVGAGGSRRATVARQMSFSRRGAVARRAQ
jgi:hypothetical protein